MNTLNEFVVIICFILLLGEIVCEAPNNNLSKYEGTLNWKGKSYMLDNDKMLLRGCVLRNSKWCYGVVVFAGRDTKLMQNSGKTIFKRTSLDRLLNLLIIGVSNSFDKISFLLYLLIISIQIYPVSKDSLCKL